MHYTSPYPVEVKVVTAKYILLVNPGRRGHKQAEECLTLYLEFELVGPTLLPFPDQTETIHVVSTCSIYPTQWTNAISHRC